MSVIIHNTFVFDVATVIFSVCLDPAREMFQDHSNTGRKILNQCSSQLLKAGLAFDDATLDESEKERKMCKRKQPVSFHPSPSFSSSLCFLSVFFLFSLLTAVIVSFSLSKNIVFLSRFKGGEFSTCVLPFHL